MPLPAEQVPHQSPELPERHAPPQQAELELSSLDHLVQGYFEAGLAPSTRWTYQSGINHFLKFCSTYRISPPIPVSQSTPCYFISSLASEALSYSTTKSYLSAIRHLHIRNNLPEPRSIPMPKLSLVERSIHKSSSKTKPRLPLGPAILQLKVRAPT